MVTERNLDHGVHEQRADLLHVARHAGDGVPGSLLAVVVEAEGVDLRVQGLAHVEDGLLPESLEQVAPERGDAPGDREDQHDEERYPRQK